MNSPLAGLAMSLGGVGSQTSNTCLSSWVCQLVHLVLNPLFLMIATFQCSVLFHGPLISSCKEFSGN